MHDYPFPIYQSASFRSWGTGAAYFFLPSPTLVEGKHRQTSLCIIGSRTLLVLSTITVQLRFSSSLPFTALSSLD